MPDPRRKKTRPIAAARDATADIKASGTRGYKPGEVEDLESTVNFWNDPKLRKFDNTITPAQASGASFGMQLRSDAAAAKIPDAKKRKSAATRTLQQILGGQK